MPRIKWKWETCKSWDNFHVTPERLYAQVRNLQVLGQPSWDTWKILSVSEAFGILVKFSTFLLTENTFSKTFFFFLPARKKYMAITYGMAGLKSAFSSRRTDCEQPAHGCICTRSNYHQTKHKLFSQVLEQTVPSPMKGSFERSTRGQELLETTAWKTQTIQIFQSLRKQNTNHAFNLKAEMIKVPPPPPPPIFFLEN